MCKTDRLWQETIQHMELRLVLCDDLGGQYEWRGRLKREGMYIKLYIYVYKIINDLHFCMAEPNTTP